MTQGRIRGRFGAPLVALVVVTLVAVMGIVGTASAKPVGGQKWVLGVSNTLVGNGWREEMICAVKAQALSSGKVSKVIAFGRGLVAAVPVNIVLIAIAAMVAARLGYAWLGGSEGRDDASRFTLVVLALAGLVRYLTWPRRA